MTVHEQQNLIAARDALARRERALADLTSQNEGAYAPLPTQITLYYNEQDLITEASQLMLQFDKRTGRADTDIQSALGALSTNNKAIVQEVQSCGNGCVGTIAHQLTLQDRKLNRIIDVTVSRLNAFMAYNKHRKSILHTPVVAKQP
jgi:hypothetical protein